MKKWLLIFFALGLGNHLLFSQTTPMATQDTICGHPAQWDQQGNLLAWYQPRTQGAAYAQVIKLASEFIKSGIPVVPELGLKMYLVTCCFQGPHIIGFEKWNRGEGGERWMHNPACVYAGLVQGLVLDYRVYAGDPSYVEIVREMLDYQLQFGTTPADWPWAQVPYASSDPFEKVYQGATHWEHERMRGDGLHGIEPDKVGELG